MYTLGFINKHKKIQLNKTLDTKRVRANKSVANFVASSKQQKKQKNFRLKCKMSSSQNIFMPHMLSYVRTLLQYFFHMYSDICVFILWHRTWNLLKEPQCHMKCGFC